jgi:hypothetical protein
MLGELLLLWIVTVYKITPWGLKYLARCVELLKKQTQLSCENKMGSFGRH